MYYVYLDTLSPISSKYRQREDHKMYKWLESFINSGTENKIYQVIRNNVRYHSFYARVSKKGCYINCWDQTHFVQFSDS